MKALSVQQPWAWLIVNGHKDVENRNWSTPVRDRVLIHASQKLDASALSWIRATFPHIRLPDTFERGGIVGEVRIVDCLADSASPWFVGKYGFALRDAKPLPFTPLRGFLGFFEVTGVVGVDVSAPPAASPSPHRTAP